MLRHALRECVPANAVEGAPKPEPLEGFKTSQEALQALRGMVDQARAAKRWQKSVKPVLDAVVTLSREDGQKLSKESQDAYFKKSLEFLGRRYEKENILTAVVHRDETTPHMQVLIAARYDGNRLSSSKLMGNRTALSKLQDDFYDEVGRWFNLQRGEKRSKAKHVPVRALYAAMNAGIEPPRFEPVPLAPGLVDRLRPGYREKVEAREQVIERNNAQRETLLAQAALARQTHPALVERQADRYRKFQRQADAAEEQATGLSKRVQELRNVVGKGEVALDALKRGVTAKQAEYDRLDTDIDRLRAMRDRERGSGLELE
jgi:hypothetical protein